MQDKTNYSYSNQNQPKISQGLQNFINVMVEEIVLKGEAFDEQKKKWLKKYSEAEGLNYAELEGNLNDFLESLPEYHSTQSQAIKRIIKSQADNCFISESTFLRISLKVKPELLNSLLIPYRKGNKWGFCDLDKKIIVPCIFDDACHFSEGLACVKSDEKWGYINDQGNQVIPFQFYREGFYSDGLAHVEIFAKHGFIDKSGQQIIPLIYDEADDFSEGLARVKINGKYGFIDRLGRQIIPIIYDYAGSFSEGLASVKKDEKYGFIDTAGKLIIPIIYDYAGSFSEGLVSVEKEYKYGFIDKKGDVVISFIYSAADFFKEGLASVMKEGKYGFIDKKGDVIIPFIYDLTDCYSEGVASVKKDNKYGFIDKKGNGIMPFVYESLYPFNEGQAVVGKNGKYGIMDKTGKLIIPYEYDFVNDKKKDFILVGKFGNKRYCGRDGTKYWEDMEIIDEYAAINEHAIDCEIAVGYHLFFRGYISKYFITDAKQERAVLENPFILICDMMISKKEDIVPILEMAEMTGLPLLIIAESYEEIVLQTLIQFKLTGRIKIAAVEAPGFGDRRKEMLEDIAIITNGTVITKEIGNDVTLDMCGRSEKVIIDDYNTFIINGSGKETDVIARIRLIENQIETTFSEYDKEKLKERLVNLKKITNRNS